MNMTSLVIGFILGVVSTFIFTFALKLSAGKASGDQASGNKPTIVKILKVNSLMGVFVLVSILAGLIYWKVGSPDTPSVSVPPKTLPSGMAMGANSDSHVMGDPSIGDLSAMAQKLAAKLEKNPENAEGWALLAHTYVEIKQHKDAVAAFEKAVNLIRTDPQLFADYADALAVTNNGQFDAKTNELVEQSLKLDPNHPKSLLLAGTIAFKQADYVKAIKVWEQLQPLIDKEDTALIQDVAANIAEAKSLISKK